DGASAGSAGARRHERPLRFAAATDRRHSNRHGWEGDSRSAGAHRRRAEHAAERAGEARGSLASRASRGRCGSTACSRAGPRRSWQLRQPVSPRTLSSGRTVMGFFETFWTWLNGQLSTYISDNTALLANALEPAVVTFATLY